MNIILSIFFVLFILFAVIDKIHKILVFLVVLAVFTDVFTLDLGPIVHLSNVIGFFVLPMLTRFYFNSKFGYVTKKVKSVFNPLWMNFFYLILLGILFGFLIPWTGTSGYRTWAQEAGGRSIVTLVRLFNEFCIALYLTWAILSNKVSLRFIVYSIGWITLASFLVGIIEYASGYPVFRSLIQDKPKILTDRFLGLCGEPKTFGRNSALAYIIIYAYYLKMEKNKRLLFFIIVNTLTVISSLSASTFILFAMFNIYLLIDTKKVKLLILMIPIVIGGYFAISDNPIFEETQVKIDKALFGSSDLGDDTTGVMGAISRFDIFDHLAYVFLINNPAYFITGTGPNLISIPASQYVGDYIQYNTYALAGGIDSVPNVMFNNVLAASGIVGLILYTIFFKRIYKFTKKDQSGFSKNLVVVSLIFSMVYFSIVLLFLTGIVVGILCKQTVKERMLLKNKTLSEKLLKTDIV